MYGALAAAAGSTPEADHALEFEEPGAAAYEPGFAPAFAHLALPGNGGRGQPVIRRLAHETA
jgi:hypothetical protein